MVLSVTILETTKTRRQKEIESLLFYRSQFWRLQKLLRLFRPFQDVLSVTILETTKTVAVKGAPDQLFYRSQFWRLQKPNNG